MMLMKRTGSGRRTALAAMAAAGGMALAAPSAAEVVLLDCEVSIRSTSDYGGGRSSTEESGTWQLRLDTDSLQATVLTMPLSSASALGSRRSKRGDARCP